MEEPESKHAGSGRPSYAACAFSDFASSWLANLAACKEEREEKEYDLAAGLAAAVGQRDDRILVKRD